MKRNKNHVDPGNIKSRSEAERLKEKVAKTKGVFRHSDFHAIDSDGLVLERTFYETGETIQVHLTKNRKVRAVYMLRRRL